MSTPTSAADPAASLDLSRIRFRVLHDEAEIAQIAHLREALQLSDAVRADPGFIPREKKRSFGPGRDIQRG